MNNSEIKNFNNNGFLISESPIDTFYIKKAIDSFNKIKQKVFKGEYKFFRVYDDYTKNPNISGIEMVFHPKIINQNIIQLLNNSKIINYAQSILGKDIKLTLSRYHITENISHVGNWHRDCPVREDINSIQINYYLFDEKGIQVVPNSHVEEISTEDLMRIKKYPYDSIKNSKYIEMKQNQILIFNPAIFHRGICLYKRANLHFRFEKCKNIKNSSCELGDKGKKNLFQNIKLSEEWAKVIFSKDTIIVSNEIKEYKKSKNIKSKILRFLRLMVYNSLFFLPFNFWIYRKLNVRPNLKLRKFFKIQD